MLIDAETAARIPGFTPADLVALGPELLAHCPACRVLRVVDVAGLVARGYGDRPIAALKFRCHKCGGPGEALATWRDRANAHRSHTFRPSP
jgi:hypothetical protein